MATLKPVSLDVDYIFSILKIVWIKMLSPNAAI
jgi:hypothetical protein